MDGNVESSALSQMDIYLSDFHVMLRMRDVYQTEMDAWIKGYAEDHGIPDDKDRRAQRTLLIGEDAQNMLSFLYKESGYVPDGRWPISVRKVLDGEPPSMNRLAEILHAAMGSKGASSAYRQRVRLIAQAAERFALLRIEKTSVTKGALHVRPELDALMKRIGQMISDRSKVDFEARWLHVCERLVTVVGGTVDDYAGRFDAAAGAVTVHCPGYMLADPFGALIREVVRLLLKEAGLRVDSVTLLTSEAGAPAAVRTDGRSVRSALQVVSGTAAGSDPGDDAEDDLAVVSSETVEIGASAFSKLF